MFCPKCGYDGIYQGLLDLYVEDQELDLKNLQCLKCDFEFFVDIDDL